MWVNKAAKSDKNGLIDEIKCSELLVKSWSSNVLLTDNLCSQLLYKSKEYSEITSYVKGITKNQDSKPIKLDKTNIENIIEIKKKIQNLTGGDDIIENKDSYYKKVIKIKSGAYEDKEKKSNILNRNNISFFFFFFVKIK